MRRSFSVQNQLTVRRPPAPNDPIPADDTNWTRLEIPLATPLAAYLRVPLTWYQSTTHGYFEDETHTTIRRVYTHPTQDHTKRHFCGFCGTPLSYWSEDPMTEAEYISLTLGSLLQEDLLDLEDMGLLPDDATEYAREPEGGEEVAGLAGTGTTVAPATGLKGSFGVPWFEGLVQGTKLGTVTHSHLIKRSQDGRVEVEWEVVEFSGDERDAEADTEMGNLTPAKRKREGAAASGTST